MWKGLVCSHYIFKIINWMWCRLTFYVLQQLFSYEWDLNTDQITLVCLEIPVIKEKLLHSEAVSIFRMRFVCDKKKERLALQNLWCNEWKPNKTHNKEIPIAIRVLTSERNLILREKLHFTECVSLNLRPSTSISCFLKVFLSPSSALLALVLYDFKYLMSLSAVLCKLSADSPINLSLFFSWDAAQDVCEPRSETWWYD